MRQLCNPTWWESHWHFFLPLLSLPSLLLYLSLCSFSILLTLLPLLLVLRESQSIGKNLSFSILGDFLLFLHYSSDIYSLHYIHLMTGVTGVRFLYLTCLSCPSFLPPFPISIHLCFLLSLFVSIFS